MKMRYFYRVDQKREPILSSNVRRKSKPSGKEWREIRNICCVKQTLDCTCGPRFFLKLDNNNNPVDYSIIKRFDKITPEEGLKFMELPSSTNECCTGVNWSLDFNNTSGSLTITENGVLRVSSLVDGTKGHFKPVNGATIVATLTNACTGTKVNNLSTTVDGVATSNTAIPVATRTFTYNIAKTYAITALSSCS